MEQTKQRRKLQWAALVFLLAALVGLLVFCRLRENANVESVLAQLDPDADAVTIDLDSGFYTDSIFVTVETSSDLTVPVTLYYSLDGNDPTTESPQYNGGIFLPAQEGIPTVYPLKVAVCYKDICHTVAERTYVLSAAGDATFSLPVISLSVTADALYNEESGIFINYSERGDEWLRSAHLTMFDADGSLLLERGVGLGVSGNTSAADTVKSLRIEGGEEFDANAGKLVMQLFASDEETTKISRITEYNHVRLRSGSQDFTIGCNIRSSLMSRLAEQSNFDGCTATQRCIVYLNGEFYSIMDLQQPYSSTYLADRFSLPDNDFVETVKGSEVTAQQMAYFDAFFADLNDEDARAELESTVDVDNFLLYYAIEILANNTDWPLNNFEMWRYTGDAVDGNPYTDGRWRFLIFDSDLIYFSQMDERFDTDFFEGCLSDTFINLMENTSRGANSVFPYLMQSTYYRDRFITLVSDLLNTSFRTGNVMTLAREEYMTIRTDAARLMSEEKLAQMDDAYIRLRLAIRERESALRAAFTTYFGVSEQYRVQISTSEGAQVQWSNQTLTGGESYKNDYYSGVSFTMTAQPQAGYTFAYWLVNGAVVRDATLTVSDKLALNGTVTIRAICRRAQEGVLVIQEISTRGSDDWIKLSNAGTTPIELSNYYLSDDGTLPLKYQLPAVTLDAGESILINGKKNLYALGNYICNFNLKCGETLYLHHADGTLIEQLAVPLMTKAESYGRDPNSGLFVFFNDSDGERRTQ